ncbi:NAD(P)-dependent oxidoreductase [Caulobacter segnis]
MSTWTPPKPWASRSCACRPIRQGGGRVHPGPDPGRRPQHPRAWSRVRENNFALEGLIGRNLSGRVAGVVGTGRIGALVARMLRLGFTARCWPATSARMLSWSRPVSAMSRSMCRCMAEEATLACALRPTPATHHLDRRPGDR